MCSFRPFFSFCCRGSVQLLQVGIPMRFSRVLSPAGDDRLTTFWDVWGKVQGGGEDRSASSEYMVGPQTATAAK